MFNDGFILNEFIFGLIDLDLSETPLVACDRKEVRKQSKLASFVGLIEFEYVYCVFKRAARKQSIVGAERDILDSSRRAASSEFI